MGRFAPSPTGPLHFGSLFTAVASYLSAKSKQGLWLIRLEDVDRQRCKPHFSKQILDALEAHGLVSDQPVRIQSEHYPSYLKQAQALTNQLCAYHCTCTRASVKKYAAKHLEVASFYEGGYPNLCRSAGHSQGSLRLRVDSEPVTDLLQGVQPGLKSDPVLVRKDSTVNYVLSCALDDANQGVTEVVRGLDLMELSSAQRQIRAHLGLPNAMLYAHLPLIVQNNQKLSKQNLAKPLDLSQTTQNLHQVLSWLQTPVEPSTPEHMLAQAVKQFDLQRLGQIQQIKHKGSL